MKLILPLLTALLIAPLSLLHAQSDSPAQTFGVNQLNALHWGADDAAKWKAYPADLAPAKWIWLPVERTLPNTFALFRKTITLGAVPKLARGWITADSRYRLTVNGKNVQWGIAPSDPRTPDVDPVDLAPYLQKGENVIGIEVLYFGHGDGTWPDGRAGLLAHFVLEDSTGNKTRIVTDNSWQALLDRAYPPGQHQRVYLLRALQEEFDSRLRPDGWDAPGFQPDALWTSAAELSAKADKPVVTGKPEGDKLQVPPSLAALHTRQIPLTKEVWQPAAEMTEQGRVRWKRPVDDWFDVRMANSFTIGREPVAQQTGEGEWTLPANAKGEGWFLTFRLPMLMVGWPTFEIEAPAGTVVELMVQEGHDPKGPQPWLETFFYSWSRFISKGGKQRFRTFDYESACWVQLHIHEATAPVKISGAGMTRRLFDWPSEPVLKFAEPALDRLFGAGINRTKNLMIETVVDCMGRERVQYSGDMDPQHWTALYAFGETRLTDRFLRTWTQGQSKAGYFIDGWPAHDRLTRLAQRELDGTKWGPLMEQGLSCMVTARELHRYTGDPETVRAIYPRFRRYVEYLRTLCGQDGILRCQNRIEIYYGSNYGIWGREDHACSLTLMAVWGLRDGLIPLAEALGETQEAQAYRQFANELLASAKAHFWSAEFGAFVNNLPRLEQEKAPVFDEVALTLSLRAGLCPEGRIDATLDLLEKLPATVKRAVFWYRMPRLTELAKHGRTGTVLKEFREVWAQQPAVTGPTFTIPEGYGDGKGDSNFIFCHTGNHLTDPLFLGLLGFEPAEQPGGLFRLRPQLGDLQGLETDIHTTRGPIHFKSHFKDGAQHVTIVPPAGIKLSLNVPASATSESGPLTTGTVKDGWRDLPLTAGTPTTFRILSK